MIQMDLVNPDKEWRLDQKFFSRQFDMDIWIKWKKGKSSADLVNIPA